MIDLIRYNSHCTPTPRINVEGPDVEVLNERNNQEEWNPNITRIVLVLVRYMIPIVLIVYGSVHLHDCPAQQMLPIGMIVVGGVLLLSRFVTSPAEFRWAFYSGDGVTRSLPTLCFNLVLQIVLLCWFFLVCYWVYSMKPDTKAGSHDLPNYCDEYFFRGTFWGCTVALIFFGLSVLVCGVSCYLAARQQV